MMGAIYTHTQLLCIFNLPSTLIFLRGGSHSPGGGGGGGNGGGGVDCKIEETI